MTPFKPGRYWYDTLGLPAGVEAEIVTMANGAAGVRFYFTTMVQAHQLGQASMAFGSRLNESGRVASVRGEVEPPEVGPTGRARKG